MSAGIYDSSDSDGITCLIAKCRQRCHQHEHRQSDSLETWRVPSELHDLTHYQSIFTLQ